MRCVQCGTELPEGSRFCSSCGAKQPEAPPESIVRELDTPTGAAPGWEGTSADPERQSPPLSASAWPEARNVPQAPAPGIGETPRLRRSPGPETSPETENAPPPVSEPIAVRLTKPQSEQEAFSGRPEEAEGVSGRDEAAPPQMRPVPSSAGDPRFAPPRASITEQRPFVREAQPPERSAGKRKNFVAWIVPPLLAICAAGALVWQVSYERGVSAEAAGMQRSAVDAALGGNYEIAESKLGEALAKRPDDPGIRSDIETVQTIRRLDKQLTEVQRLLGGSDVSAASAKLSEVQQELSALKGGAYNRLRARFDKLREQLELADIRSEAESTNTVAELGGLLDTASDYSAADKQPVVEWISDRIVEVGGNAAEQAIASGSYHEAAAAVDEAQSYVPEAQRLIELEQQIASLSNEGDSTDSELVFLSGAELKAGKSELRLTDFEQKTTDSGMTFSGRLSNASSASMHDLLLEYRAYAADGSFLGEDWKEVTPSVLKTGDAAFFSAQVDSAGEGTLVVIDSISWYRE